MSPGFMHRQVRVSVLVAALVSAPAFFAGCRVVGTAIGRTTGAVAGTAVGIATGVVSWSGGELKTTLTHGVSEVNRAVGKTITTLQLTEISSMHDELSGSFVTRCANDELVTILVERDKSGLTEICVRAGAAGGESLSRLILDEVKRNL